MIPCWCVPPSSSYVFVSSLITQHSSLLPRKPMTGPTHRTIRSNGIDMHVAEQGTGPLVVLCHGFPECWYSWRHQIQALAAAGFRAVAPDMRGYGRTDAPDDVGSYTL